MYEVYTLDYVSVAVLQHETVYNHVHSDNVVDELQEISLTATQQDEIQVLFQ